MARGINTRPSMSSKITGRIITVDPSNRMIEAGIRDGAVKIPVKEAGPLFRWPRQNELWTFYREGTGWKLGDKLEENGMETQPIEDLNPGDIKISSDVIYTETSRVWTAADEIVTAAYNVRAYGAVGDGVTNDTAAFQDAIAAADAAGGGLVHAPAGTYLIDSIIDVPNFVSFHGDGKSETILKLTASGARLRFNDFDTAGGTRGGASYGFQVDANSTATLAMDVQSVNREFSDIRVVSPAQNGVALQCHAAQNCRFYSIDLTVPSGLETPTGTIGLKIDASCGGLSFNGLNMSAFSSYHILIDQTVDAISGLYHNIGLDEPTNLRFTNCMIERGPEGHQLVSIKAGRQIWFEGCAFSLPGSSPASPYSIIRVAETAAYGITRDITFRDFTMSGDYTGGSGYAIGFDLENTDIWTRIENGVFKNCAYAVSVESGHGCRMTGNSFRGVGDVFGGTGRPNRETVASVNGTMTINEFIDMWMITGTNTITGITATYPGHQVVFYLQGAANMTDGGNLKLAGSLTGSANDTITLLCDGVDWFEVARSAN